MRKPEFPRYSDELRTLIMEHPDYPIVVLCGEECNTGDYSWMVASSVTFHTGELLDCDHPFSDDRMYSDRDDFEEDLEEWVWDEMCEELDEAEPSEEEFQKRFAEEKQRYEEYWMNVIYICANN